MANEVYPIKEAYDINDLLNIMKILRSENGCAWDREQDHRSIQMNVLEEAYEVMEAIEAEDSDLLKEELGDLLLQVVFHTELEAEKDSFEFNDVCDGICKKLIYRHPHVFGSIHVENSAEVLKNWDSLKSKAKGEQTATERLKSVPKLLPALMRGDKVCKRAANSGIQRITKEAAIENIKNQAALLEKTVLMSKDDEIEDKIGELLFACCNLSSVLKKDSEKGLTKAINRFIMHFREMEESAAKSGLSIDQIPQSEINKLFAEYNK